MVVVHHNLNVSRDDFFELLKNNQGVIIFKFGATWCRPCKLAEPHIEARLKNLDDRVTYITIDVDDAFDLYGFLQTKKMVNGIPAVLAYVKGNTNFASDFAVMGCDSKQINAFFDQVSTKLT